jgi:tRNA(Glu) U13 pseudouridine synthase TruD
MPEPNSTGATLYATMATICTDETRADMPIVVFEFTLPPGSYPTAVLRELMKASPWAYWLSNQKVLT